jgi:hypothetical protein
MKLLFVAALLGSTVALAQSADEAAVKTAHDAYLKAAKAGDKVALAKLFAPGLQYSHSTAKLENKQEAIDAMAAAPVDFEIHSQAIKVYGATATLRAKATARSSSGVTPLSILMVWVKNGGNWQIVERQTTRLPQ